MLAIAYSHERERETRGRERETCQVAYVSLSPFFLKGRKKKSSALWYCALPYAELLYCALYYAFGCCQWLMELGEWRGMGQIKTFDSHHPMHMHI